MFKHSIGAALEALSTCLKDNIEDKEETHNTHIYMAKLDLLKIVNPPLCIEVCNDAIGSGITSSFKVKFAKEKVKIVQSLGMGLKYLKEAKTDVTKLAASSVNEGPEEKGPCDMYKCDLCDGSYTNKRNLINHKSIKHRSQERCDKCSELFSDKAALDVHSKECEWVCQYCSYKSLRRTNLQRHTKRMHGDRQVEVP